ncbi:uncharacterized protein LOC130049251 [Ostrea edulis]|uniref:uncharacterized protein LOC130049251 n=1 Tax=Ostrea edulis TaxID=37623 RepID=UPI0024AFE3C6|nr:uncharacterized protein LOC130049251 [Ostrea edulis]
MNFDVDNIKGDLKSEKTSNETDTEQTSAAAGICIAEVNFDVQNIEGPSASSDYLQPNTDTYNKEDKMSIALSTGLCIADMNFDIENTEHVSDSSDYLEPTEFGFRTHILQGEESDNKTYEQLQNVTDTKVSIPNLEGLNENSMQDDANDKICFADLHNFQEIMTEIESVEKSASWIRDSSANEYEKLGKSTEIDIDVPEEDQTTETPTPFTDFGPDVCFAELLNFEQLLIESEAVEQAPSDDSHGSHYDEIKINVEINHGDGSDRISK